MLKRKDDKGTAFTNWVRTEIKLDPDLGYVATDIDLIWKNTIDDKYMIIEEKRWMHEPSKCQWKLLEHEHILHLKDDNYLGLHLLQTTKNGVPEENDRIFWDRKEITREELIEKLRFVNVQRNSFDRVRDEAITEIIEVNETDETDEDDNEDLFNLIDEDNLVFDVTDVTDVTGEE